MDDILIFYNKDGWIDVQFTQVNEAATITVMGASQPICQVEKALQTSRDTQTYSGSLQRGQESNNCHALTRSIIAKRT